MILTISSFYIDYEREKEEGGGEEIERGLGEIEGEREREMGKE